MKIPFQYTNFFTFETREEWLAWRQLGASDAAVIMGHWQYKTPLMLWKEKVGITPPSESNAFMEYGKDREPKIIQKLRERFGWEIHEQLCTESPSHPFFTATLDGYVKNADTEGDIIIEVKAPQMKAWEEFEASGFIIPPQYWWQMQHQMLVSGIHRCLYVVECFDTGELHLEWVTFDMESVQIYIAQAILFWERVKNRIPPKPSFFKGTTEPAFVVHHPRYQIWATEIDHLKNEESHLKEMLKINEERRKELAKEVLQAAEWDCALVGSYRIREVSMKGSIDWKAVGTHYTQDQAVDWEAFTKKGSTRLCWTSAKEADDV